MSELEESVLDNCGCCKATPDVPPIYNRPGLPALSYRVGTYAVIFRHMQDRIGNFTLQEGAFAGTRPLAALTTREQDDPSIALLDASAVMADVLAFYQERIANEGFLRTATERRSVLEMARAIGYELNPGVAAGVYLTITVDDAKGAPGVAEIPAGTKVQSVPPQNKKPQTFETSTSITVRKEWNALRPSLSERQDLLTGIDELYLKGSDNDLSAGDAILISNTKDASDDTSATHVASVAVASDGLTTHVTFDKPVSSLSGVPSVIVVTEEGDEKIPFDESTVEQYILRQTLKDSELSAFLKRNEWDVKALEDFLAAYRNEHPNVAGFAYVMRTRLGVFGNNAPKYDSLPANQRFGEWVAHENPDGSKGSPVFENPAYPDSWEERDITTDSQGNSLSGADFFLERSVSAVHPKDFVALENATYFSVYRVTEVIETTLADYGMSAKVTGLSVYKPFDSVSLNLFKVRETTAYVQSQPLVLTEKPLTSDLPAGTTQLELDGFVFGIRVGQAVCLSGNRADAEGLERHEILIVKEIEHDHGWTTLIFESGFSHPYKRETLTLNANTVVATHGETAHETLGSGDGSQVHQKFTLKKPPLTYTAAPTPSGSASTLHLRVEGLLWEESPSLYGLGANDQNYIVRIADDGKASVIFGDGLKGARLPSGQNNVTAVYRSGIGLAGEVEAGTLTLLQSRPLGVRGVVNRLPASGAGDPEKLSHARQNAPLTVRTLDRIVSREDYEDFAAAFAGIGKAQAIDLWDGEQHLIHVTIAGADGRPVKQGDFLKNFIAAINKARDPSQRVKVDTFDPYLFDLNADVAVDKRYEKDRVFAAVKDAISKAFSFEKRAFGQPVTAAEVMSVIQDVDGVVYVDLNDLYLSTVSTAVPELSQILPSDAAHMENGAIKRAGLLLVNNFGVQLQEVTA